MCITYAFDFCLLWAAAGWGALAPAGGDSSEEFVEQPEQDQDQDYRKCKQHTPSLS